MEQSQEEMRSSHPASMLAEHEAPRVASDHHERPSVTASDDARCSQKRLSLTIEQSAGAYLEAQRKSKRQAKTLEWHQTALHLFQQYLHQECGCERVDQITETQVRGWFTFLCETPTVRGQFRSVGTRESYARSARAFCHWLTRHEYVKQSPFAQLDVPQASPPALSAQTCGVGTIAPCLSTIRSIDDAYRAGNSTQSSHTLGACRDGDASQ